MVGCFAFGCWEFNFEIVLLQLFVWMMCLWAVNAFCMQALNEGTGKVLAAAQKSLGTKHHPKIFGMERFFGLRCQRQRFSSAKLFRQLNAASISEGKIVHEF